MVGLPFNPLKVQVFAGNLRTAQNRYHALPSRTGVGSTVVFNSPQAEAEAARAQMMEASHLRSFSSPFVFFLFSRLGPWVTQSFGKNHLEVYGFGFGAMGPNPFFFSRRKGQGIFPTWLGLGHWSQAHSPPLGGCIHADPGRSLEPAEAGGFLVANPTAWCESAVTGECLVDGFPISGATEPGASWTMRRQQLRPRRPPASSSRAQDSTGGFRRFASF